MKRIATTIAAVFAALASLSLAVAEPTPTPKPQKPVTASLGDQTKLLFPAELMPALADRLSQSGPLLSDSDRSAFEDAYDAVNRHDWPRALEIATQIHHPVASKIITWAYLTAPETSPSFDELVRFIQANPDWPLQDTLLEKAEKALPDNMPPARLIAWFAGQEPLTGEGMVRLGAALIAQGEKDYGERWLKRAWEGHDFSDVDQSTIYATYKDILKGQPTIERADYLLWSYDFDQAQPLLSELPEKTRRIDEARIALMKQSSDALAKITALPASEQKLPSILFEKARYLRRSGKDDDARAVLLSVKEPDKVPYPEKWWVERSYQARQALEEEKYDDAYKLLSHSGLTKGGDYADAEWMSGWVALRFLKKPKLALQHFQALEANVSYPISLARAAYWAGRAAEAMGDTATAVKSYSDAAAFPYTFYGQLAASSHLLSNGMLDLTPTPALDESKWGSFVNNELVTAIRLLKEIDGERYMRTLGYYLADKAQNPEDIALVAELFREIDKTAISVRVAKRASYEHTLLTDYLYPILPLPPYIGINAPPEPALVLGFARQESEFNPKAVSAAGAMGILQLIPSTAQRVAKKNGIAYRGSSALTDLEYSLKLGMAHIGDLLDYYDGSYILTAAAYNAGVNNVDSWIKTTGDPRSSGVDPIDWIETIPFTETRNYVQRVLENTEVYRQRIAGRPVKFSLVTDLERTSATPLDLSYLKKTPPQTEAAATPAPKAAAPITSQPPSVSSSPTPSPPPQAQPNLASPSVAPAAPPAPAEPPSTPPPSPSTSQAAPPAPPSTPITAAPATPTEEVPSMPLADTGVSDAEPGSMGAPPSQAPSPSEDISPDASAKPDIASGATPAAEQGGASADENPKIPKNCVAFMVRPDNTSECIDWAQGSALAGH